MPADLRPYFELELEKYEEELMRGELSMAWTRLERAHIIGQRYPRAHSRVHWKMLLFGFKTKNAKEILGQLPRLFFGGVKSFVGKVPVGNPGGANVPPLKTFPISAEIAEIFRKSGVK